MTAYKGTHVLPTKVCMAMKHTTNVRKKVSFPKNVLFSKNRDDAHSVSGQTLNAFSFYK